MLHPASQAADESPQIANLAVTREELRSTMLSKYGPPETTGPAPSLWYALGYATPDDHYETLVAKLVREGCDWLDVGCGRDVFPNNRVLAQALADRCGFLMGIDPDATIADNRIVHLKQQTTIEQLLTDRCFDLITLRMVAEHLTRPAVVSAALAKLCKPGGLVVVYTVNRWSPASLGAWFVPFRLHHSVKRLLWLTEPEDTFPVAYLMNTRRDLLRWFSEAGFTESSFDYLDDCCLLFRFAGLRRLELAAWRVFRAARLRYPENCLLAVFRRNGAGT